ncbi:MAG: mobile mystery protein A [Kordiimonadaceae bacterium]|nr:mobile mystery protein A [Kordiimonadaceae bacterium]
MLNKNRRRARQQLDKRLADHAARDVMKKLYVPPKGYIRAIRDAIGMTAAQLGQRLNKTPQSMLGLEKSEEQGSISIKNLKQVAEAMDCNVVYAIVPKESLEQSVNAQARAIARKALQQVSQYMLLEDQKPDSLSYDDKLNFDIEVATYISEYVKDRDLWALAPSESGDNA